MSSTRTSIVSSPAGGSDPSATSAAARTRGGGGGAGGRGGDGHGGPAARLRRSWRRNRFAWALIAPAVAVMVLIHLIPTAGGVLLSFREINTFTFARLFGAPWAGAGNYDAILFETSNPLRSGIFNAAGNTLVYTVATVGGTLVGGMALALLLNRDFPGQKLVRTLMLTPWVVPSFVVAVLWQFMWQSDVGIVNKLLVDYTGLLGERPVWLLGENSMWAIVIPSIWRGIPLAMLIFLAGLQAVPKDLHEAASLDGAGAIRRFRSITLPLLRPLIAVQLLFTTIYAAYQFTIPWVMLGSNPGEDADLLMTLIVRQSFSNNLFGIGAAASTLLTIVMLVWVAAWWLAFRRDMEADR
jgi:multiple sugar transport system permease protein